MDQDSKEQRPERPQQSPRTKPIWRYSAMATQMGITIFLGVWGGQKLDKYFQTKTPWFTLLLSLVSVGIALYAVIKDFTKKAT